MADEHEHEHEREAREAPAYSPAPDQIQAIQLWQRLHKVVHSIMHGSSVEDVVHDTWIACVQKGVGPDAPFVTLKHMALDAIRKLRRQERACSLEDVVEPQMARETVRVQEDKAMRVLLGRASLTTFEGQVVLRMFYDNFTMSVTADELGVTKADVKVAFESVKSKLRSLVENES